MAAADVQIVPAEMFHVELLAPHTRQADREELWAAAMVTPETAMRVGIATSPMSWTGSVNGEILCMFGVAPVSLLGGLGAPWLIGADAIERYQMAFLRHSRPMVQQMRDRFPVMTNHVDDRNKVAIRWLRWLGFVMGEAEPHGPFGLPFRKFEMRA